MAEYTVGFILAVTKKMSKSDASDLSRINLTDDADTIARKIRKAKTDPAPLPDSLDELKERPEAENLIGIFAALNEVGRDQVIADYAGKQFSEFKPALAELAVEKLAPVADEMRRISADRRYIEGILQSGGERSSVIAEATMKDVRKIVGLLSG